MLHRPLTNALLACAALVLLFEEWFWDRTAAAFASLGRRSAFARFEAWIRGRSPGQALALYAAPVMVVYPCKALALVAMGAGYMSGGVAAFVLAKLAATAVFARLYQLTEPAIVQYAWVRRGRDAFLRLRMRIHHWLNTRPFYRRVRERIRGRSLQLSRRYRAAYRLQQGRRSGARRYAGASFTTSSSAGP
ncbi:MAG TPA: hypothetical protein VGI14_10835 [Casimicrobiaceae bacterium]|jgi:hypothetical protein